MAMVSSSLGPINSLLDKLPAEPEFRDLRHGLESIKQHLLGFSDRGVLTSTLARRWLKHLSELAYNIEDWIDDLIIHSWGRFKLKWWSSHQLARIQTFKDQIRDMHDSAASYGLRGVDFDELVPSMVTVDLEEYESWELLPKDRLLCGEKPCFFGLGGPESKLVQHLIDDEQRLKVVCILGPAGLGKTTLARELFRKQQSQFDCRAFVCLGRNPSIDATIMDIARQVMPRSLIPCDEKLISTKLWEFLGAKRYLIVIDDIWSVQAWSPIRCVMRENDLGSRVLVTTEIKQVANSCCVKHVDFVYFLKALNDRDSRSLMLSRISETDKDRLVGLKIFQSMIKVCGGSPLAIAITGGLLAAECATLTDSTLLEKAILSPLNQDSASQVMEKLLDISYVDLPLYVKTCFLYLSAFPENYTIKKDCLIRRWIAEGFVPIRNEESLWETGEMYFNELVNRRLIQPVLDDDDDELIGCTVHGVVRDFILLCEENFVALGANLSSKSYPCGTIRRLSIDCNKQDEVDALATNPVCLSRVRSFTVFGNAKKMMPDLSAFKLVRVLDLEDIVLGYHLLKSIGNLSLLRYLGLRGTGVTKLPKQIMALEDLNTVDLRRTMVTQLPPFRTVKLASLLVDRLQLQRGLGEMQYLEELSMVFVTPISSSLDLSKIPANGSDSLDDVAQLVSKSKLLRMLAVRFDGLLSGTKTYRQVGVMHFLDEVAKSSIQSLILHDYPRNLVDLLVDCWACTMAGHLRKFDLRIDGHLLKVPQKIASLVYLTHLHIKVYEVEAKGLHSLGKLPNLVLLNLISEFGTLKRCIITRDCFPCLKILWYNCCHYGMGLQFEPGTMPQLQSLRISFEPLQTKIDYGDFSFGIQYLSRLARIHATINCWRATALEVEAAEAAIRQQISQIPNIPLLQLSREGYEVITDKGKHSSFLPRSSNVEARRLPSPAKRVPRIIKHPHIDQAI